MCIYRIRVPLSSGPLCLALLASWQTWRDLGLLFVRNTIQQLFKFSFKIFVFRILDFKNFESSPFKVQTQDGISYSLPALFLVDLRQVKMPAGLIGEATLGRLYKDCHVSDFSMFNYISEAPDLWRLADLHLQDQLNWT